MSINKCLDEDVYTGWAKVGLQFSVQKTQNLFLYCYTTVLLLTTVNIILPTPVYTMEYYLEIIKKEILPCAITWMDLQGIMLSEISQTEKDKYHMTSFIVESKSKQTNE